MICLVTDRLRLSPGADAVNRLVDLVGAAAAAGVDIVQVRERDLGASALAELVRRCVEAVRGTGTKVVVNDRTDVAIAAGAHGVHLRAESIAVPRVRSIVPGAILGRSVHSADEATAASRVGGIDYLILGTLFPTQSKDASRVLTPVEQLATACRLSAIPVLAIGGITLETAPIVAAQGAAGIAAIGVFIPPEGRRLEPHVQRVVADLRQLFDSCRVVP